VQLLQHAINGQTSNELLDLLTYSGSTDPNYDTAMVDDLKKGNIITLCIGGNDLMQWATIPGFTSVDWANADISANDFVNSTWVQLIDTIKTLNPTAKLIVTTGYNPYNLQAVSGYESDVEVTSAGYSFSGKTESLVTQMRSAVLDYAVDAAGLHKYEIADVYKDFHDNYGQTLMGQITLFYPYFLGLATPTLRDPHPNQTGQNRISNLIKTAFLAQ
jgi:lysophospholipase L1-like esterase